MVWILNPAEKEIQSSHFFEIVQWLKENHWQPEPDLRKNVALLTRLFIDNGFDDHRLEEIKQKLKNDPRARVRRVFEVDKLEDYSD